MHTEMREETRVLDGHPFHLRHWGDPEAPILLMLHGFPEYGGGWADLAPHLAGRFHCIAPDQRGYGRSWAPRAVRDYATSKLVGDMAALITALGRGPVNVLGHDWGAAVAYGLAMFRPELVARLIVANGVHPVPFQRALAAGGAQSAASQYINLLRRPGSEAALSANDFKQLVAMFLARYRDSWLTDEKLAAYKAEWARDGRLETMLNWYRASPLKIAAPGAPLTDLPDLPLDRLQVRCPHLLIWGEGDTALLPSATEGLEDFVADLTRVTIRDADHWLHHQKPQEVAAAIRDWTDRQGPAA